MAIFQWWWGRMEPLFSQKVLQRSIYAVFEMKELLQVGHKVRNAYHHLYVQPENNSPFSPLSALFGL